MRILVSACLLGVECRYNGWGTKKRYRNFIERA